MKHKLNKPVVCADGFKMSVQASETAYCTPRITGAERYTSVEVGFPNRVEPLILPYAEEPETPCDTVYPRTPSELVTLVIVKHGGMVEGEVPSGVVPLPAEKND